MYIIGGYGVGFNSDVWSSSDGGVTWVEVTPDAGWSGRWAHSSVIYDNKIYVLGGYNGSKTNDIWSSSDGGVNWVEVTGAAAWSARYGHTSVVYNDIIYVMGGDIASTDSVWSSSNGGVTWIEKLPPWSSRYGHTSVVHDSKIYVLGGWERAGFYSKEVWLVDMSVPLDDAGHSGVAEAVTALWVTGHLGLFGYVAAKFLWA